MIPDCPASLSWLWTGTAFSQYAGITLTDRGFRYGMALFESLAVRGGRVEFLEAHLIRLETSCRQLGWPMEPTVLACAGERLLERHRSSGESLFARIYVTAGEGAPTAPVTSPRILLFAEPRTAPTEELIRVNIHPEPFAPLLGGLKTANYWPNILALQSARAADCDEALLFNPRGELISACMANVFVECEGQWITPPLASGARAGVVREWVMQRRKIVERLLSREDLHHASACFLTNCWSSVIPVAALDARTLPTSFAETLRAEFFSKE